MLSNPQIAPDLQRIRHADRTEGARIGGHAEVRLQHGEPASQMEPAAFLLDFGYDLNRTRHTLQCEVTQQSILWQTMATRPIELLNRLELKPGGGEFSHVEHVSTQHVRRHLLLRARIGGPRQTDVLARFVRIRHEALHVKHQFATALRLIPADVPRFQTPLNTVFVPQTRFVHVDVYSAGGQMHISRLQDLLIGWRRTRCRRRRRTRLLRGNRRRQEAQPQTHDSRQRKPVRSGKPSPGTVHVQNPFP